MALKRENESLKTRTKALEELVNRLKCVPDEVARITLHRLRATSDPSAMLEFIRSVEGRLGYRPSDQLTALSLLPAVHSEIELQLMAQHPTAYPMFDPTDRAAYSHCTFYEQEAVFGVDASAILQASAGELSSQGHPPPIACSSSETTIGKVLSTGSSLAGSLFNRVCRCRQHRGRTRIGGSLFLLHFAPLDNCLLYEGRG